MNALSVPKDVKFVMMLQLVKNVLRVKYCLKVFVSKPKNVHLKLANLSKITNVKHVKHRVNTAPRQVSVSSAHRTHTCYKVNALLVVPLT